MRPDTGDSLVLGTALPGQRVVHTRPLAGGYRNDNILVVTGDGQRYVLRRYRYHNTCAKEAALAERLAGIVPVPEVIAADPDGRIAGEAVLLSRFVSGMSVKEALNRASDAGAYPLGLAVGRALAAIGGVTFPSTGVLDGDLRPVSGSTPTTLAAFVSDCLRSDGALQALDADARTRLLRHAERAESTLATLSSDARLVHSDFNPKNVLTRQRSGEWVIAGVLDWEFALSGSPLIDIGNMLRFADERPAAYTRGFLDGFSEAGGRLPDHWRELSEALDLFALADFLTRPPDSRYFRKAVEAIRKRIAL